MPRNGLRIGLRGSFLVQIDVRGGPGRSRGVPGSISGLNPGKPARNFLARLPSGTQIFYFSGCREMALGSVCGADVFVDMDVRGEPRRSKGAPARGSDSAKNPVETGPELSSQTAFRYPVMRPEFFKKQSMVTKRP